MYKNVSEVSIERILHCIGQAGERDTTTLLTKTARKMSELWLIVRQTLRVTSTHCWERIEILTRASLAFLRSTIVAPSSPLPTLLMSCVLA